MPVTLILKSLKRPSWLCSQTGTKMSPFSPPWNRSGGTSRPPPRWESGASGSVAATARPFHAWHSSLATMVPPRAERALTTLSHLLSQGLRLGRALVPRGPAAPHLRALPACRTACEKVVRAGAGWGWDLHGIRSPVWGLFSLLQTMLFKASPTNDVVC